MIHEILEKILHEKEAEIEKVTTEMKAAVERLELDNNLLRESNNKLVEVGIWYLISTTDDERLPCWRSTPATLRSSCFCSKYT
jgi:hypothetical protein